MVSSDRLVVRGGGGPWGRCLGWRRLAVGWLDGRLAGRFDWRSRVRGSVTGGPPGRGHASPRPCFGGCSCGSGGSPPDWPGAGVEPAGCVREAPPGRGRGRRRRVSRRVGLGCPRRGHADLRPAAAVRHACPVRRHRPRAGWPAAHVRRTRVRVGRPILHTLKVASPAGLGSPDVKRARAGFPSDSPLIR